MKIYTMVGGRQNFNAYAKTFKTLKAAKAALKADYNKHYTLWKGTADEDVDVHASKQEDNMKWFSSFQFRGAEILVSNLK
jgi:hypothetical protein